MYLLYLDESGDANGWQDQQHFVLAGIAVYENSISSLDNELQRIQEKYFPQITIPIAFHATDIRRGKGQFDQFLPKIREDILNDVYNIIRNTRFPACLIFATAMHISKAVDPLQVRRDTLEDICQRFNTFLMRQHKANMPSKGLLIIDQNREDEYRQLVAEFKQSGTKYGYLGNVVDIPYFARCHETRMLQLADFVANATFRYYEKQETKDLDIIYDKFDRQFKDGPHVGLKHFTKNINCPCKACSEREYPTKLNVAT
jgi:hypothetical protein